MDQLEVIIGIIPILEEILSEQDAMFTISNREKVIYYRPGKTIDIGGVGKKVEPGDGFYECIQSGRVIRHSVAKESFGVPFRGLLIPLKNERKEVIGCLTIGWSYDQQEKVTSVGERLSFSVEEIVQATEGITNNSQTIASSHDKMLTTVTETESISNSTLKVTNMIKRIANQSTVIALNGSIEAARAGRNGKIFAVVANEIHRLAKDSGEAVIQIDESLNKMKNSVGLLLHQIEQNEEIIQSQAAATSEIHASISEVKINLENLLNMANDF